MLLLSLVLIPLLFAAALACLPKQRAFSVALIGTLVPVIPLLAIAQRMDWTSRADTAELARSFDWIPELGLKVSVGLDTVSFLLVALSVLLGPICVAASRTAIDRRVKTYYFWLLTLQGMMTGVFLARDVILFYVFFEFTLIPMFVLINLYGSTNRKAAATKFFLYTFTGSVIALAGLVFVAWQHASIRGSWTFDLPELARTAANMPLEQQLWVFAALMLGFSVKVPLFPVHTWLPLAHTEAPTAGSVVLAGVLLKLGTYAIFAIAIPFCPQAAITAAPFLATLAIAGIILTGLICWVQTDVKKLVAYSSVAHLGFCMLGLFSYTPAGVSGSVLYMINHGLSTGALFLLIGMVYERYHTRSMKELGGLAAKMPVWATFMVFFAMASVGLPGLNGFISEFMCLLGAFQSGNAWGGIAPGQVAGLAGELGPYFAAVAGTGMIIAAIYTLYMVKKVVWGPLVLPPGHDHHNHDHGHSEHTLGADAHHGPLPTDLSAREITILLPLAALCLGLGLYPKPALSIIQGPVDRTVDTIRQARAQLERQAPMPVPGKLTAADSPSDPAQRGSR